jgi:outer membrane protein TolC
MWVGMGTERKSAAVALMIAATLSLASASVGAQEPTLTFQHAMELGRKRAPELRSARANARSEDAQDDVARGAYYPRLAASLSGQAVNQRTAQLIVPQMTGSFTYTNTAGTAQGSVNLQWTLYDFGKTAGAVRNADAQLAQAIANVGDTTLDVEQVIAAAYMNFAYGEKLRDVAKQTLDTRERFLTIAKGLIKQGLQPPLEEIRATARADASRRDLANAVANALDAKAVLAALLGLDPNAPLSVEVPKLHRPNLDVNSAMRAAEHIPSVIEAYEGVNSAEAAADTAQAQFLPTVSLQAGATYGLTRYDTYGDTLNNRNASALLVVSGPLFDATLAPGLRAAREGAKRVRANADTLRRNAVEAASRAAIAVTMNETALAQARKAAEGSGNVLTIVQARYIQGLSSPLELIDAETEDSDARTAEAQAELGYALAIVNLCIATGTPFREDT